MIPGVIQYAAPMGFLVCAAMMGDSSSMTATGQSSLKKAWKRKPKSRRVLQNKPRSGDDDRSRRTAWLSTVGNNQCSPDSERSRVYSQIPFCKGITHLKHTPSTFLYIYFNITFFILTCRGHHKK